MFIKKNLSFFPARLVFQQAGGETPQSAWEQEVKKVEKKAVENPQAYENADKAFDEARNALKTLRDTAAKEHPDMMYGKPNLEDLHNEAQRKLEANKDNFKRILDYSKRKTDLSQNDGPLTRYESTVDIKGPEDVGKLLDDQAKLNDFDKMAKSAEGLTVVKEDFAKLNVEARLNNIKDAFNKYYTEKYFVDDMTLTSIKDGTDKRPQDAQFTDLNAMRARWENFQRTGFQGAGSEKMADHVTNGLNITRSIDDLFKENPAMHAMTTRKSMEDALAWLRGSNPVDTSGMIIGGDRILADGAFQRGEYKDAADRYEKITKVLENLMPKNLEAGNAERLAAIREEYPNYKAALDNYKKLNTAAFAPDQALFSDRIKDQQQTWAKAFEGPESTVLRQPVSVENMEAALQAVKSMTVACNEAVPALQAKIAFKDRLKDSGLKVEDLVKTDDAYNIYLEGGNFNLVSGNFGAAQRNFDAALAVVANTEEKKRAQERRVA